MHASAKCRAVHDACSNRAGDAHSAATRELAERFGPTAIASSVSSPHRSVTRRVCWPADAQLPSASASPSSCSSPHTATKHTLRSPTAPSAVVGAGPGRTRAQPGRARARPHSDSDPVIAAWLADTEASRTKTARPASMLQAGRVLAGHLLPAPLPRPGRPSKHPRRRPGRRTPPQPWPCRH